MFKKLMLAFIFILFGCSGLCFASDDSAEAEKLTDQGWKILRPGSASKKGDGKDKKPVTPRVIYDGTCDAPEVAAGLFEKAAALDPFSVKTWLGWGVALERLALCPAGSEYNWIELKLGLNYRQNEARPRRERPLAAEALNKAYEAAADKYSRAVELEPGNTEVLRSWGHNLIKRAKAETRIEVSRRLAEEAFEKYARLASLNPDKPESLDCLGRVMLEFIPYEPEEARWKKILIEAEDKIWRAFEATDASDERQNEKTLKDRQRIVYTYKNVIDNCGGEDRDKIKALLTSILEKSSGYDPGKTDFDENLSDNPIYFYYSTLGDLYLSLSLVQADEKQWRQSLDTAKEKFESANQNESKYSGRSDWSSLLIRTAKKEKDSRRRQLLVEEALALMDKMETPPWKVTGESGNLIINPSAIQLLVQFMTASHVLPVGDKRDKALKKAEMLFEKGLEETRDDEILPVLIITVWSRGILMTSEASDDPLEVRKIVAASEEKYLLTNDYSSNPNEFLYNYASALIMSAGRVTNQEIKRIYLQAIVDAFHKYGVNEGQLIYDKMSMYDILVNAHLNLALLDDSNHANDDSSVMNMASAIMIYNDKMTWAKKHETPYFLPMAWEDRQINLAQILLWAGGRFEDRNMISQALMIYRDHLNSLPQQQFGYIMVGGFPSGPSGKSNLTFQESWSPTIAHQMQTLRQTQLGQELGDWETMQLAGLYRFLLASRLLSKEYQELYFQRASASYRKLLDREKSEAEADTEETEADTQTEKPDYLKKQDDLNRASEISQVRVELGLLLAEKALITDSKSSLPEEAKRLWAEAEEIQPGSSRYARARLAAWRGEKEEMKEYLRHGPDEARLLIYPSFDQARQDPAFAEYKDSEWFRRAWYGLQ